MLINNADLIPTLCEDISFKEFSYIPQRLRAVLYVKSHLLRCAWQAARKAAGNRLRRVCAGGAGFQAAIWSWPEVPFIPLRLHIQRCFVRGRTECRAASGPPAGSPPAVLHPVLLLKFLLQALGCAGSRPVGAAAYPMQPSSSCVPVLLCPFLGRKLVSFCSLKSCRLPCRSNRHCLDRKSHRFCRLCSGMRERSGRCLAR